MFNNAATHWESRRQKLMATSSTEAEYIAMSSASKHATHLYEFIQELQLVKPTPLTLIGDSKPALCLANDFILNKRSKHFRVRFHHIRSLIKDTVADILRDIWLKRSAWKKSAK